MTSEPVQIFKSLADNTRLMLALLIHQQGELCVCELTHALDTSQPKISRHLAHLRSSGLLTDRRRGQWVYYDLSPTLPDWARAVLESAAQGQRTELDHLQGRLKTMENRPNSPRCA